MSRAGVVGVIVAALALAPAASPSRVTSVQLAALAKRALTDRQALADLRAVDRVDGTRVDLASALDATGSALAVRLRTLAATPQRGGEPPTASRADAHAILTERRFTGSDVPRPLHGPVHWLGDHLRRAFEWLGGRLPGGPRLLWVLITALIVAAAAFFAMRLGRRRGGRILERSERGARGSGDDPRRLEREADEAERQRDFERALRLRFRAGLIRLTQSDALPARRSLTNGEIARRLESHTFTQLAGDFDEVVYGRRGAGAEDIARARESWPRVFEEARR